MNIFKENIVLTSALAECFLKKMRKEGYINYIDGSDFFETIDDVFFKIINIIQFFIR